MCFDTDVYLRGSSKIYQELTVDVVQESMIDQENKSESGNVSQNVRRRQQIRTHLSTCSPSDKKPYKCPDCDTKFSERKQVYHHISITHKDPKDIPARKFKKEVEVRKFQYSEVQPKRNYQKCRICLNEICRTVFNLNDEKLCSLFISCTGIDVRKCSDISSSWICGYCERKLFKFYSFQEKCWDSDIFQRLNDTSLLQ